MSASLKTSRLGTLFLLLGLISACKTPRIPQSALPVPTPPREFRAVWVATVNNIDWPSQPGLSVADQKAEMIALLDRAAALNLNAILFQVRPAADAFYDSPFEPWSEFLTGQQGRAPEPLYDPLAFAIEEAHKRNLELHAWFNPYRAWHPSAKSSVAPDHVLMRKPQWVRVYGANKWLDPGDPEAAAYTQNVILDVVRRYQVDGVHIDDYFYPYPVTENGKEVDFPDAQTYTMYGNGMDKADWRRENVNRFVETLYRNIKSVKPWVKFGISPFGIWRPGFPEQIKGFDQYDKLYADAKLWLNRGWLDYFTPQLYWPIAKPEQSYPVLLNWWLSENTQNRHMWPGSFSSKVIEAEAAKRWDAQEIVDQVKITQHNSAANGSVHFSMKSLMASNGVLGERLRNDVYRFKTLVPASPWLGQPMLSVPELKFKKRGKTAYVQFKLKPAKNQAKPDVPDRWIVRGLYGNQWFMDVVPGSVTEYTFPAQGQEKKPKWVAVSALNQAGMEGTPTVKYWR